MTGSEIDRQSEGATLVELLRARAAADPGRRTWSFLPDGLTPGASLSAGELDVRARAVAAVLQERGLRGQPVLLAFPPGLDFLSGFFGCLYAGAVAVPVQAPEHPRALPRVAAIARGSGARLALTSADWRERLRRVDPRGEVSGLEWLPVEEAPAQATGAWRDPGVSPDDLAFLQYTSGSTAEPKGVMVAHRHLLANEAMIQEAFGQGPGSVVVGWLPLFHDMGLVGTLLQPLWSGGRCLLMAPATFLQRPLVWLEAVSRHRATTSGGPSFAYDLCARRAAADPDACAGLDLSSWQVAFNGAEPVRAATLERFTAAFAPAGFRREALRPCYGLAEATLLVSAGPAVVRGYRRADLERGRAVPAGAPEGAAELAASGRPVRGQTVRVVDPETRRPSPPGVVGEIWVAGPSVAAGYWRRPEATAETFGAHLADGSGPFLRTGDLGFLDGGELFVTGRVRELLVVRGRNLYPQDLERTAEEAHPLLRPGGGAAFAVEGEAGEEVALVLEVDRRARDGALDEIVAAVRQALAEACEVQPRAVVLVRPGAVPRTSSGKTRRRACAAVYAAGEFQPLAASTLGEGEALAEAGDLRRELAALDGASRRRRLDALLRSHVGRLLGAAPDALPAGAPLTALGLDSLRAMELAHAVETATGVVLAPDRLLGGATLEGLGEELAGEAGRAHEGASAPAAGGAGRGGELPLSRGQRALWLLQRLAPESPAWHLRFAARLAGSVDPQALARALRALAARHPLLRARVRSAGGEPVLAVGEGELELTVVDATAWSAEELTRRLAAAADRPFDLAAAPPLRAALYRLRDGWALGLTVHHLVADLWSLAVLARELGALYRAERSGAPAALPGPAAGWDDYVRWQEALLAGPAGEGLLAFWRRRLAGAPVLELPADAPPAASPGLEAGAVAFALPPELVSRLEALARREGTTLYAVLLGGVQTLLHRLSGSEDVVVGSPVSGRSRAAFAGLVGYCANLLPLRGDLSGDPPFRELLRRTGAVVRDVLAHQDLPFPALVEALAPPRRGRHPLFDVVLAFERPQAGAGEGLAAFALGQAGARLELGELSLESLALPPGGAQFDLLLTVAERGGGLAGALEYRRGLFDGETAARLARQLERLLAAAADDPDRRLSALPLLGAEERRRVLAAWNDTTTPYPRRTVHELFAAVAEAHPGRIALECGDERLTYAELADRARQLAHRLRATGVGPGELVGVALPPSCERVVALLATLEAGAAYLPLDPGYPRERLAWMLDDARARVLVTTGALLPALPAGGRRVLCLDAADDGAPGGREGPPPAAVGPEAPAYVMYTSGSTGRPKGIIVPHRAVVRLVRETSYARFGPDEVFLHLAPASFDASTFEVWGALLHGATLAIAPAGTPSPEELGALLRRHRVTTLWLTAGLFHLVAERRPEALAGLRQLLAGGDVLSPEHVARVREACPGVALINGYGPTEGTTFTCCHTIRDGDADRAPPGASIPIGCPIANTRVYVVDPAGEPVPVGAPGELRVGGDGLAWGYLHRPALTAERFVPDPFGSEPGGRLYRTGDRVRWRPDGTLEFLGRLDQQVKVRGFRVEPGEVEAALAELPEVAAAAVGVRGEGGDRRLVAYLVPRGERTAPDELRAALGRRLPEFMLPGAFVWLPALPLTPNGKVDRARLPEPGPERPELAVAYAAPRGEVERTVAAVWAESLGVERVGRDDNFFDLGGHSLLLSRVHGRLERELGRPIPIVDLFEHPTVAALARHLAGGAGEDGAGGDAAAGAVARASARRAAAARRAVRQGGRNPGAREP